MALLKAGELEAATALLDWAEEYDLLIDRDEFEEEYDDA